MENTSESIKKEVRARYAQIAGQGKAANAASCCGATDVGNEVYNIMTDDYTSIKGYVSDTDLGLGCGLPTQFAHISPGDTVVDLGSGAGNDCFVARHETGADGKVIGVDFTPEMLNQARKNARTLGFNNVEFREGDIETMPVLDEEADVVVSNCVLNLVPDKHKVFTEIFRVLKPGGHFSISDIVLVGELPEKLQEDAEMYAGCVSGAIQKTEYLNLIDQSGFINMKLQKEKAIKLPDDILSKYLTTEELNKFKSGSTGIYSISVYAEKPGGQKAEQKEVKATEPCCGPECC